MSRHNAFKRPLKEAMCGRPEQEVNWSGAGWQGTILVWKRKCDLDYRTLQEVTLHCPWHSHGSTQLLVKERATQQPAYILFADWIWLCDVGCKLTESWSNLCYSTNLLPRVVHEYFDVANYVHAFTFYVIPGITAWVGRWQHGTN